LVGKSNYILGYSAIMLFGIGKRL